MDRSDGTDFKGSLDATSSGTFFDASQYAFFGQNAMEEVELGGLEDEDENPVFGSLDDQYHLFEKDEGAGLGSLSDIDDLATTFAKLNRVVTGPRNPGVIGDRGSGSFSRESSSATDWAQDGEFAGWLDQQIVDAEIAQEGKRWWSQPQPSSACFAIETKPLYRTSSYPQQPLQYHFSSEPPLVPKSESTSFHPPGGRSQQASPYNLNIPSLSGGMQLPFCGPNLSPLCSSNHHLAGLHQGLHYGGNVSHVTSPGLSFNNRPQKHWVDHSGLLHVERPSLLQSVLQRHLSLEDGLMSMQFLSQQQQQQLLQQRLHPSVHPSLAHRAAIQSQTYGAHHSSSHIREPKHKSSQRGRQSVRSSQQGSDTSSQKSDSGWVQFRSKYMTAEEIESVLKMQHASTHSNDPYIDDYYHQASLAKRSGSRSKHHFCPSQLKELPSRSRNSSDQHSHVHVDALGKIPIPSIRCPRSLLEVDPSGCGNGSSEHIFERPLEQEPLLAARITIEDCLAVLLDVEDIDRFLLYNQPQDGGSYLRCKRQVLLEAVAASLQLVDPLGPNGKTNGKTVGLASKDDIVFLRLVSLPKGQKLISKFLKLLFPGSELTRIVCMAIFRHLRFLFGGISPDPGAAETTANLVKTVSTCVSVMDLCALSACLVAVVCSTEQPPFRPLGSPTGDGASIILKSLLEKATTLLNNTQAAANCNSNFALWQASFDDFFELLTKYCLHKYDTILQSVYAKTPFSTEDNDSEICGATKSEMPVELLRACLPHTNDRQMELLRHFGQQRNPVSLTNPHSGSDGHINSESVRS